jgi:hypothetical protein
MNEDQYTISFNFNYKDKYCVEDTTNYKYFRREKKEDEEDNFLLKSNGFCYKWNEENDCYVENIITFRDDQAFSISEISQTLGCISCCKDCSNHVYMYDLQSLKSKSISNVIQYIDDYKIVTFRNRQSTMDYPILYHTKNKVLRYCSIQKENSPCSNVYTCYPVIPRSIISNEVENDIPNFANIIFILLFIVIVIAIIALIWIVIYVFRTYRRHKKINQIVDVNGEVHENVYDSQEDKEYLSDNYDYCYKQSEEGYNDSNNNDYNNPYNNDDDSKKKKKKKSKRKNKSKSHMSLNKIQNTNNKTEEAEQLD